MSGSFLCVGECMVELADAGDGLYRRGFAGDTFNTAWYACHLLPTDWTVAYGSCVGTDAASNEMLAFMEAEGIDTSPVRRVADRSVGLYMTSLKNGERSFSYWRSQSAARLFAEDVDWLDAFFAAKDVIYFSGISLAILGSEGRKVLCAAIARARVAGSLIAFDTNLRPRLWESQEAMQQGMLLGASVADVVLPSFDEETVLFGDETPAQTVDRYRAQGATTVAVKNGGGDLLLWDQRGARTISAIQNVPVVDSTAAGDSFGAAFVSHLAVGGDSDAAAVAAMELASKVIQSRGALVPAIFEGGK